MSAPIGKHVKAKKGTSVQHGKHAGVVRVTHNYQQIIVTCVLAVMIFAIPFSFNRLLISLNESSAADASYTAKSFTTDVQPEATPIQTVEAPDTPTDDVLLNATTSLEEVPVVDYANNVQPKLQQGIMSAGCELISLDIVLQAMGLETDIHRITDEHLVIDGHFGTGYSGNPYYSGSGYSQGITKTANSYLQSVNSSWTAYDITGSSFELLQAYVAKGYPVLVWCTMGYEDPAYTGVYDGEFEWYLNEHCVVMYGFDGVSVLISDPLEGLVQIDQDRFIELYSDCGSMAMVIR